MSPSSHEVPHSLVELVRALREGGVRIGPGTTLLAATVLAQVDVARREDVRAALRSALICEAEDLALFDSLFEVFYPAAVSVPAASGLLLPRSRQPAPASGRLADALATTGAVRRVDRVDLAVRDASGTASADEVLAHRDFEQMTTAELEAARALLRSPPPRAAQRRTRRLRAATSGPRLDQRRMLRDELRGADFARLRERAFVWQPRDWVLLVDISGSMAMYSRMFLQLAHALARRAGRVETFVFATRLTRVTRGLRSADPDAALQAVTSAVPDWDGGTRIADCLAEFNLHWSRRVLARGAWVVLLTDGLERGPPERLEAEVTRLRRGCRELIWINPLRRFAGYRPLAAGAAVLARHATRQRSAHNVASLLELLRLVEGATGRTFPAAMSRSG